MISPYLNCLIHPKSHTQFTPLTSTTQINCRFNNYSPSHNIHARCNNCVHSVVVIIALNDWTTSILTSCLQVSRIVASDTLGEVVLTLVWRCSNLWLPSCSTSEVLWFLSLHFLLLSCSTGPCFSLFIMVWYLCTCWTATNKIYKILLLSFQLVPQNSFINSMLNQIFLQLLYKIFFCPHQSIIL